VSIRIQFAVAFAVCAAGCATPKLTTLQHNADAKIWAVVSINRYEVDGMLFTPDQICPSVSLTIESPRRYAGRSMVIGLIPSDPKMETIYAKIASLVGKRIELEIPESLKGDTYMTSPEFLNYKEMPNQSPDPTSQSGTVPAGQGPRQP